MNFTIPKELYRKLWYMLISILLLINATIIMVFDLNPLETILLLIATPTLFYFILKFVLPLLQKKAKTIEKSLKKELLTDKQKMEYQIELAKKEGKRAYRTGPGNKHIVYAANMFDADNIFNKKIAPLAKQQPNKIFKYVTAKYNNL